MFSEILKKRATLAEIQKKMIVTGTVSMKIYIKQKKATSHLKSNYENKLKKNNVLTAKYENLKI